MLVLGNKLTLNALSPTYHFVNKYSVVFDGVDQYIAINNLKDTISTGQAFTISVWFKSTAFVGGAGTSIIFSAHTNSGGNIYRLGISSSGGIFYAATVSDTVVGSTNYSDSKWHHLAVTRSTGSSTSTFYVDGVSIGTIASTNPDWDSASKYSIGQEFDGASPTDEFIGNIDELALYDRELTQEEITRMYNTYYSPNRVANGNFSQIGNEEVENGNFSEVGAEEVTNGSFNTSIPIGTAGSGWAKVVSGDCTVEYDNGGVKLTQANVGSQDCKVYAQTVGGSDNLLTVGKQYKVTYEVVSNNNSTSLKYYRGGSYLDINHTVGTHTFYYKQETNQLSIFWNLTANSDITLDNVSVKEVGQDWEMNSTATFTANGINITTWWFYKTRCIDIR